MIKVGTNSANAFYLGVSAVDRLYYNGEMIWPGGDMTYFLLADGTIARRLVKGVLLPADVPSGVVSAQIGDVVAEVGAEAFAGQAGLSAVGIPIGVESIGNSAFQNCSSLAEIVLPDGLTSVGNYAFQNCAGLSSAVLPDGLVNIWWAAFERCDGLSSVEIPASVQRFDNYAFANCAGLASASVSCASTGPNMFDGCHKLSSVSLANTVTAIAGSTFANSGAEGASMAIPDSVSSIGEWAFYNSKYAAFDFGNTRSDVPQLKNAAAFEWCDSSMLILVPDALYDTWTEATNWSDNIVKPHIIKWSDYYSIYFTAVDPGATIAFKKIGSPAKAEIVTSLDAKTWQPYAFGATITLPNVGDTVYFRAKDENNISFYTDSNNCYKFQTSGADKKIAAAGNIQSLIGIYGKPFDISDKPNCYKEFFQSNKGLVAAPTLPATALANNCYQDMFKDCSSLTSTPALPAKTLASNCYRGMFYNCSSLTTARALPATTLANSCYQDMFKECSSLTTAPTLSATTLASWCCSGMFWNCTSLTAAPALPASALASFCYRYMFRNCISLTGNTTVTLAQTSAIPDNALYQTFNGTTSQAQLTFMLDLSDFTAIPQLPNATTISVFDSASDTRLTIKVPASLLTTWKESSNWSMFADRIIAAT